MSVAHYFDDSDSTDDAREPRRTVALRVVADDRPALSRREVEVLLGWLAADSKAEAAERLYITASTVNTHLTRIRAKYTAVGRPARSKANLFARAIQDGYTTLDQW
ncbi:LuxR C-terminal-related transcriptional regulator [Williamsia sp. M5A3_1d]